VLCASVFVIWEYACMHRAKVTPLEYSLMPLGGFDVYHRVRNPFGRGEPIQMSWKRKCD